MGDQHSTDIFWRSASRTQAVLERAKRQSAVNQNQRIDRLHEQCIATTAAGERTESETHGSSYLRLLAAATGVTPRRRIHRHRELSNVAPLRIGHFARALFLDLVYADD